MQLDRDKGSRSIFWFDFFFFFFEMGDTQEVSLQVEMIQEKGLLMCVSYVQLGRGRLSEGEDLGTSGGGPRWQERHVFNCILKQERESLRFKCRQVWVVGDQKTQTQLLHFLIKEAGSSDQGEQRENDTKSTIKQQVCSGHPLSRTGTSPGSRDGSARLVLRPWSLAFRQLCN